VQALPAVTPIPVISSTQRGAIYRDILQVAERDYQHVLRSIALQEISVQSSMGNKPTGMLVDGRRSQDIGAAQRSVRVWFADRKAMADAIIAARDALVQNGRRATGRTLGALAFYYSIGKGGTVAPCDPTAITAAMPNPAALDLYVALPLAHVRKWQWLTKSGTRGQRRTRNKLLLRYARATGQKAQMVSKSVFETSAKQVQRRFRSLDVKDIYLSVSNLNLGGKTAVDRIPAIKVRLAVRGRGR
jgi:hypothetical protein